MNVRGSEQEPEADAGAQTLGLAPHVYRLGRRIEIARQRLLDGQPPADVAVSIGFCNQSQVTRHFKRHVGTTPGRCAVRSKAAGLSSCLRAWPNL